MEWIVVCSHFHTAYGPFKSWNEAKRAALKDTMEAVKTGAGCSYTVVSYDPVPKPKHSDKERGYL